MNCYARRNMNFVLYKEFLNPCRLKRLQFTFHLFHKFSTQDKGSHVFISKGNNLPTIAQCKFKNVFYSHTRSYVSLNYYNAGDSQDSSFTSLCTHYKFISVFHNFKPKTINVVWKQFISRPTTVVELDLHFLFFFFSFFLSSFFGCKQRAPSTHISMCLGLPSTNLRWAFSSRTYIIDLTTFSNGSKECLTYRIIETTKTVKNASK